MALEELRSAINQTKIAKKTRMDMEIPLNDGVRNLRNRTTLKWIKIYIQNMFIEFYGS